MTDAIRHFYDIQEVGLLYHSYLLIGPKVFGVLTTEPLWILGP